MVQRYLSVVPGFESLHVLLQRIAVAIAVLLVTWIVVKIVRFVVHRYWHGNRLLRVDPTYVNFIKNLSTAGVYIVGFGFVIYNIPELRAFWVSLLASAGIIAAIIGFASQQAFSNIISGVFIVLFKPIRVDDTIEVDQRYIGVVEDITIRHVILRNARNQRIVIPNSVLSSATIINYDLKDAHICSHVEITLTPTSPLPQALAIMRRVSEAHPLCIDQRSPEQIDAEAPVVDAKVVSNTPQGILVRAYVWSEDAAKAFECRCDLYRDILTEFRKAGIEVAFIRG